MADNKKSFLMYTDLIYTFEELTDEEAGRLIKHIFRYVNDKNPDAPDRLTKISFEPIKQALKRDLVKYEQIREKKRLAGLASAESKKQNQHKSTRVESVEHNTTQSTVNDNVIVIDNDIEIVKEKRGIKKAVAFDFSFVANNFSEPFMKWIEYKKDLKQPYKSQTSLQTCYNNLLKLSAGNPTKAMHVVDQSIGNGWAGLFEYKGQIEPEDKTDKFFANGQWHKKTPMQKYQ